MSMADLVECRADHDYPGSPLAFYWQGQRQQVHEEINTQQTPLGLTYLVRNNELGLFELFYDTYTDQWSVKQT